jgi:hypothetical protein
MLKIIATALIILMLAPVACSIIPAAMLSIGVSRMVEADKSGPTLSERVCAKLDEPDKVFCKDARPEQVSALKARYAAEAK